MTPSFINLTVFLLIIANTKGYQQVDSKLTTLKTKDGINKNERLNSGISLKKDETLSPVDVESEKEDNGLIEVKESDIPEGSMVYILEEPEDTPTDGEILKTANNIVFRPLFRYREKQEAQRRNYNRIRRRYFVPKRSYRHTYSYPYYYPYRYY